MAALPALSDAVVRELAGPSLYERAAVELGAGRLLNRQAFRNGVLTAVWDTSSRASAPMLQFLGQELEFECDCNAFANKGMCLHCAGLALAWARSPHTFERLNRNAALDMALEDLFDEDDDADLGLLERVVTSRPAVALPAGVNAERIVTTLTAQWPDVTAAYAAALETLTLPQLRGLAQRRGVALTGARREPILAGLAKALGNIPALRAAWDGLSDAARLVAGLAPYLETDFGVSPVHLRQVLQAINGKVTGQFDAALQELQDAGLVFPNRAGQFSAAGPMLYFLPPDKTLFEPLAETHRLKEAPAPEPLAFGTLSLRVLLALKTEDAEYRARPHLLAHALVATSPELRGWPAVTAELEAAAQSPALYQALSQRPLTVPPALPVLADEALARLSATLAAPPEQVDFVLRLLSKLGLVEALPGQACRVREDGFVQYLGLTPLQHVAPLFNAFMNLKDWTELNLALARVRGLTLKRHVRYGITYAQLLSTLETARFNLMQLLRRVPPGQWTDVDQLVTRARALNLLHAFWPLPPGIFLELAGQSLAVDSAENWRAFYRPFVEAVLSGPLHWQGFVDLAYRQERLAAVRITGLGSLVLYQSESYRPPTPAASGPALRYAADGSLLVAPAAAGPQLLNTLSLLGEARTDAAGQLTYTVTAAGAMRAFQAGWDAEQVLQTLAAAAGKPAPAPLAATLRQWWAHLGDVHLYTDVALMELADDYALTELLSSTSLSQHLLFRFSPRVLALRPEGVEALRAELVSRGYTPKTVTAGKD